MRLCQAAALHDLCEVGGVFGIVGVGGGKELISLLAPVLFGAKRPVLIVPAALRSQVIEREIPEYGEHFMMPDNLKVISYTQLSIASQNEPIELLFRLMPDLLIFNEAQALRSIKSGRTRRVAHYMSEHPETHVIVLSGSISKTSLRDYWHLLLWTLKEDMAPLPVHWPELQDWADALDEDPDLDDGARVPFGVLWEWMNKDERMAAVFGELEPVRHAYRRRLHETPGVIVSDEDDVGVPLVIDERPVEVPREVLEAIALLEQDWETPNGDLLVMATDVARHTRELLCGFWYRWDPAAPPEWLDARRDWNRYVRDQLKHNRRSLYTPLQVWNECARGDDRSEGSFDAWRGIRGMFSPNSVAVWISDYLVQNVLKWAAREKTQGLVWVDHNAFGAALEEAGLPYFGAGPDAARKVVRHPGVLALSLAAHGEGRDGLQQRHSRMLVSSVFSSGLRWEQMLGRLHRPGQRDDAVSCTAYFQNEGIREMFARAQNEARAREDTTHGRQKLNYADVLL